MADRHLKQAVSFRLSARSLAILESLAGRFGLSRTAALEFLIHRWAEIRPDDPL